MDIFQKRWELLKLKEINYKKKKNWENIKRNNLKYETNKCIYGFQQFKTIRSFTENIISGKITIRKANEDQSNLSENIVEFRQIYTKNRRR